MTDTDQGRNTTITRVLVVDDDPMVCEYLRTLLLPADDIEVVATAMDGAAAVEEAARHRPDVILMDLRMPGVDGIAATAEIVAHGSAPRVLVMTTFNSDATVLAALRAGASGYLLKTTPADQLSHTIRLVASGASVLSPATLERLVEAGSPPARPEHSQWPDDLELTGREREVLFLLAEGSSNADIAAHLYLSEATVKGHVSRLMAKFQCTNRTQLALRVHRGRS